MILWQIWFLSLFVKIILLPILPITPDETYYFAWGRHLQLSYFDHPPFISWIMFCAQPFWKTPFGIRLPGVIIGQLGLVPWLYILKKLKFSDRSILFWLVCMLWGPLTGIGSFIITPDLPLLIFWSLSLLMLLNVMEHPDLSNWLLLGLMFGLGMLSKYTMILFLPAMLFCLYSQKKLKYLKSWQPWTGLALGILIFSPVIIWNFKNHFASFGFQFNHGLQNNSRFNWHWPVDYLASQIGLLNPIIAVLTIIAALKFYKKQKFLVIFTAFPFLFFFLSSFRAHVEPNWPLCAYPTATALAVVLLPKYENWVKASIFTSSLFLVLIFSHSVRPWLPINKDKDHTKILRQWISDVMVLKDYHPLYARSYQLASYYSYYRLPEREVFKPAGVDRKDFYDYLSQPPSYAPGYIVLDQGDVLPEWFRSKYKTFQRLSLPSGHVLYQIIAR